MTELLTIIAKGLVEEPDKVFVTQDEKDAEGVTVYHIHAAESDMGRIIGKQNELSCQQVDELLNIRQKLGILSGGIPPCALTSNNTHDVVSSAQAQPQTVFMQAQPQSQLQGVTPLVRPQDAANIQNTGCGCTGKIINPTSEMSEIGKNKEEIIAEVVRRVTEQIAGNFKG